MQKVHMYAGAINKLLYGFVSVRATIHSLKFVDYLLLQAHTPYKTTTFWQLNLERIDTVHPYFFCTVVKNDNSRTPLFIVLTHVR